MRSGKGGLPSPTAHSAEHGAVAVAEAEAVEGPLPADHCGRAPGRVPEARPAHPGHTYLSSRSRPALAVGNRSAGGCQTGFAASIFNALPGRPIGALPPAHPTPAGRAGGPGDARCVWLSACPRGRGDGARWAQSQRGTGSASEPTPSHAMSESAAPRVASQPGNWWFPAGSVLGGPEAAPTRPLARPGPGQSSLPDADCPLYLPGLKREYANHAQSGKVCRWASKESGVHPPDSLPGGASEGWRLLSPPCPPWCRAHVVLPVQTLPQLRHRSQRALGPGTAGHFPS